jgi:formiminotetrahydrofolate cyclodeaminase
LNHPVSRSIRDLTLGEFLDRLASADPTPGGGAAAAVTGAAGAALIEMTANLTIGRPRLAGVEDRARGIARHASELRVELTQLAEADSDAFDRVSAAYRLPRIDDAQKAARSEAIQAALEVAADVPLRTMRACAQVIEVAEEAAPILNAAVISDVLVGALQAQAALKSAALNVEINLASMSDLATIERVSRELSAASAGVDERVGRVLTAGRSRFPRQ